MRRSTPTTFSGEKLRRHLAAKHLTVAELARLLNLPTKVVRAYLDGSVRPSFARTEHMADALDVEAVDLLDESTAANRLVWLRERLGLSQKEVATSIDVALSTLSRWEAAGRMPAQHAVAVAAIYRVAVDELPADEMVDLRLSVPPPIVAALDTQRGQQTRSQYVSSLLEGNTQRRQ